MVFSPNSRLLAGFHSAITVGLWNVTNGRRIGHLVCDQMLFNPTFSPDGKTLVTVFSDGSRDHGLAFWNVKTLTLRQVERVHYQGIHPGSIPLYSPDGRWLAVTSEDKIHLHSAHSRLLGWKGTLASTSGKPIQTMAFSPDSTRLLTGGKDKIVRLWDVNAQRPIAEWDWKIGEINQVTFAPDGMTAAAAGSNRLLVVWDLDA